MNKNVCFSIFLFLEGVFEVSCRTTDHYSAGMRHRYKVDACPDKKVRHANAEPTRVVKYFISAEEMEWDYSPERVWELEKHNASAEDRCVSEVAVGQWLWFVLGFCSL